MSSRRTMGSRLRILVGLVLLLVLASPGASARVDGFDMTAADAIGRSMASPEQPLDAAWILMDVCGAGADGTRGFLNSQRNYRDRASLNVELPAPVRIDLAQRLGADPLEALRGKRVRVFGQARQVRINLFHRGQRTGRFYYQTQLRLMSAEFLELIVEEGVAAPADCLELIS